MNRTTRAWIIKSRNREENKKEITVYAQALGKICLQVAGVQNIASKLSGANDILKEVEIMCFLKEDAWYGKLLSLHELRSFDQEGLDFDRLIEASSICEMIDLVVPYAFPSPDKYELMSNCMRWAMEGSCYAIAGAYFFLNYLTLSGQGLVLDRCCRCRETVSPGNIALGSQGALCARCGGKEQCRLPLSPAVLPQMRQLVMYHDRVIERIAAGFDSAALNEVKNFLFPFYLPRPLNVDSFKKKLAEASA